MNQFDSVPESIRREIERRIIDGGLEPGDRLGLKRELQDEFGVAGPTIDQALSLLSNDGLISVRRGPGGGVFVNRTRPVLRLGTKLTWARDATMYAESREIREALISLVGTSAARAQDRSDDLLAELARIADEVEHSSAEAFETHQLIWQGQRVMLRLSENRTLAAIFGDLLTATIDGVVSIDPPTTDQEATRERRRVAAHVSLFRAVIDGDVDAAAEFGKLLPVLGAPPSERLVGGDSAPS